MYAISYDPVEVLSRFAQAHGIGFPLLADVGSGVITDLGLLNTTLEEERVAYARPVEPRHRGIPYPGTFLLDGDGIVTGKRFEQSHRIRPTTSTLLRTLAGRGSGDGPPDEAIRAASPGVQVAAWLDTDVVAANQLQELTVRLQPDPGVHLYTEPVPPGFTALGVMLTGDERLRTSPVELPSGRPFRVAGLDEQFHVVDGSIDLTIPFILLSNRDTAGDEARTVTVEVEVAYQACTAETCHIPERLPLQLSLREEPNPGYETVGPAALRPLVLRRIVESPRTAVDLLALVNAALVGAEVTAGDIDSTLAALEADGLVVAQGDDRWAEAGSV